MQTVWASRLGILRFVKFRSNYPPALGSVQLLHNFRLFERKFREWAAAHFRNLPTRLRPPTPRTRPQPRRRDGGRRLRESNLGDRVKATATLARGDPTRLLLRRLSDDAAG
jgi:hypothetical protein